MKGRSEAFGAITIVNAIASGKGAALGIDLKVRAEVEIIPDKDDIQVQIEESQTEDPCLARAVVREVYRAYGIKEWGAKVSTQSNIPIAKGLKSSSSTSNAIALATLAALKKEVDSLSVVNMAVDASLKAGVTITGAFDDATASYLGGFVVTDNYARRILRSEPASENLHILIYVPDEQLYTRDVDQTSLSQYANVVNQVWELAFRGKYWEALTLNGLVYSMALGYKTEPVSMAISAGALTAGLSGTGPAIAAVCHQDNVDDVASLWSNLKGSVLPAKVNNVAARMI